MRRMLTVMLTIAVLVVAGSAGRAIAGWPTDSVRAVDGQVCTPFVFIVDSSVSYCPFISDYIDGSDSYYAHDNTGTYIDYHVQSSSGGASTSASSCRQRWTGASAFCTTPTGTTGTGYQDLGVNSFGALGGTSDQFDYYYLSISTTEVVDVIYGISYF